MDPNQHDPNEETIGERSVNALGLKCLQLTGQLEIAQASVTRWEAAYRSLAAEMEKVHTEYRAEVDRLNALNVQLTRDAIEARELCEVIHSAGAAYVDFFIGTFESFNPAALTPDVAANLTTAREMKRRFDEIPM